MSKITEFKNRLKGAIASIQKDDKKMGEEIHEMRKNVPSEEGVEILESLGPDARTDGSSEIAEESIILRKARPVLAISNNEAELVFTDLESEVWRERLIPAKQMLTDAAKAIGRIELLYDPNYEWVGTGWLVDNDVIVTNRHVANIFGRKTGASFVFRQGVGGKKINASIDYLEEFKSSEELSFKITGILHIEDDGGPDMALLRVEVNKAAKPIQLGLQLPADQQQVAIIGYPAKDSRIPDQQLMQEIFGDVYNKKRLAPGNITGSSSQELLHDCSTLGGNSGSAVIDLQTGKALGLHFAGKYLITNYAVPAAVIKDRLKRVQSGSAMPKPETVRPSASNAVDGRSTLNNVPSSPIETTFTIPLQVSITVGAITGGVHVGNGNNNIQANVSTTLNDENEDFFTEGVPADYTDREGYDPDFLGKARKVPLPKIVDENMKADVLEFKENNKKETVLKYQHFSVVMSESRRMCIYSAVNIDGKTSIGMKRGPWRLDPRIDKDAQIIKECYGNAPKFSRGHMTRREDPIWGDQQAAAKGNTDSMHVTNTTPQMQNMNAGIWLKLENYALQNARKDDMRICVFTGPCFTAEDPERYGVTIPLAFWKVIAFIHDDTKKLCATGYRISQEDFLQEEEFVFGENQTAQVSIASIEGETGLSFGNLSSIDPFDKATEGVPGAPVGGPLNRLDQIKFV